MPGRYKARQRENFMSVLRRLTPSRAILLAAAMAASGGAAWAADPAPQTAIAAPRAVFSQEQRQAIIDVVRQALRSDPSILRDAVTALQADSAANEQREQQSALSTYHADLVSHPGDPEAGNPKGDVTVVEFYDPRCPYCRKMLPGIEAMLAHDHGIRLIYKDIPVLGPASTTETRAILAAHLQGGYSRMQAALMSDPAQPTAGMITGIAKEVGLDADKLNRDMDGPEVTKRIKDNKTLAAALKVSGTPTFVVGDQIIPGMVEVNELQDAVAAARQKKS